MLIRRKRIAGASPQRRGLDQLQMTNSSQDFPEDRARAHWANQKAAFAKQAEDAYDQIQDLATHGGT